MQNLIFIQINELLETFTSFLLKLASELVEITHNLKGQTLI